MPKQIIIELAANGWVITIHEDGFMECFVFDSIDDAVEHLRNKMLTWKANQ